MLRIGIVETWSIYNVDWFLFIQRHIFRNLRLWDYLMSNLKAQTPSVLNIIDSVIVLTIKVDIKRTVHEWISKSAFTCAGGPQQEDDVFPFELHQLCLVSIYPDFQRVQITVFLGFKFILFIFYEQVGSATVFDSKLIFFIYLFTNVSIVASVWCDKPVLLIFLSSLLGIYWW